VHGWADADRAVREAVSALSGKNADGHFVRGHMHSHFLVWIEGDRPTRLIAWRATPFEGWEVNAILQAADLPLSWSHHQNAKWHARLIPLDSHVLAPPGFDGKPSRQWASATPYVPPRFSLRRNGVPRPRDAVEEQVLRELDMRELTEAVVRVDPEFHWTTIHLPKRDTGRATNATRRGFKVHLVFPAPVRGPICLGHSSHFGLGLFVPEEP
jgi:CRISPR-associated protein Csb2